MYFAGPGRGPREQSSEQNSARVLGGVSSAAHSLAHDEPSGFGFRVGMR